jgi:hypothetical protein
MRWMGDSALYYDGLRRDDYVTETGVVLLSPSDMYRERQCIRRGECWMPVVVCRDVVDDFLPRQFLAVVYRYNRLRQILAYKY